MSKKYYWENRMNNNIEIHPSAIIAENVIIEDDVYIGPNCIIGFPAEDKKTFPRAPFGVRICSGTKITGNVTIDAGTVRDTHVGRNCFLMKGSHLGHDVFMEDNVVLSCHAVVGGHVHIKEGSNLGLGCIIHQRQTIWNYSMIGMGAIVTKKLIMEPFGIYVGNPAKKIGTNEVGLKKGELTQEAIKTIQDEFEISGKTL